VTVAVVKSPSCAPTNVSGCGRRGDSEWKVLSTNGAVHFHAVFPVLVPFVADVPNLQQIVPRLFEFLAEERVGEEIVVAHRHDS
jgi:hypothetical protein